jgi:hypothetical protein
MTIRAGRFGQYCGHGERAGRRRAIGWRRRVKRRHQPLLQAQLRTHRPGQRRPQPRHGVLGGELVSSMWLQVRLLIRYTGRQIGKHGSGKTEEFPL